MEISSNDYEETMEPRVPVESQIINDLQDQRSELITKVQAMKKELEEWRTNLDVKVKTYKSEISDLKKALNGEVDALRKEFADLKKSLHQQLELTASITQEKWPSPQKTSVDECEDDQQQG